MHYIFPSDFIFWKPANEHKKIKEQLITLIKENLNKTKDKQLNKWLCDVNTEFFENDINYQKYINLIVNEIYPAVDMLFSEVSNLKTPKKSTVTQIWYNHYNTSQGQEVHSHSGSSLSGIYLLQLQEENKTVFYSYSSTNSSLCSEIKKTTDIEEGNIILFPSHLSHYVLPCDKKRITIAFNIKVDF
jgi:hypothetical protein